MREKNEGVIHRIKVNICCERAKRRKFSDDKFHLANSEKFCYNQLRYLRRVGISVLQRLPKPASDRNENLVFATV